MSTITAPDTDTSTDTDTTFQSILDNEELTQDEDTTGDHDRFSHYVDKEDIVRAATTGVAVFALCGKKWRPSKNPDNYPICPECKHVYENVVGTGSPTSNH